MPPTASVTFLPICAIQNRFAAAATPAISTRRVERSRKKRTKNRSSPCRVPHLDSEEIGRDDQFPVTRQKLLPGCLAAAFGGRFDPVALQDFRYGAARNAMTEIDQRALDAPVAPVTILVG